eukprot:EG_transcript_35366
MHTATRERCARRPWSSKLLLSSPGPGVQGDTIFRLSCVSGLGVQKQKIIGFSRWRKFSVTFKAKCELGRRLRLGEGGPLFGKVIALSSNPLRVSHGPTLPVGQQCASADLDDQWKDIADWLMEGPAPCVPTATPNQASTVGCLQIFLGGFYTAFAEGTPPP